jgi:hypothetical protein
MSTTKSLQLPTPMELYRRGVAALREQLGPVDSIRFLHLLEHGSGDYTAERQAQADEDISMAELCAEIRASEAKLLFTQPK